MEELRGSDQEPAAPTKDTEEAEEKERRLAQVWEALDRLRGGRQGANIAVLEMRCLKGMSLREIAAAIGQTPAKVKDRLRRARAAVRRVLGKAPERPTRRAGRKGKEET